jgi:TonB family protein
MWLNRFVEVRPRQAVMRAVEFASLSKTRVTEKSGGEPVETRVRRLSANVARRPSGGGVLQPNLGSQDGGESFGFEGIGNKDGGVVPGKAHGRDGIGGENGDGSAAEKSPEVKYKQPPEYPREARSRGITGSVTVDVLVDSKGDVSQVRVVNSNPPGLFDASVVQAVQAWVFLPGTRDGAPVDVWVRQNVRFDLN